MKILMEHHEIKTIEVDPEEVAAFEAGGWKRADADPYEYAWEADPEKRAQMSPRGPKILIDGYFGTPEEIASFPRGRRVRRIPAGPWIPVEETS